jgi:ankyrin repeat protein
MHNKASDRSKVHNGHTYNLEHHDHHHYLDRTDSGSQRSRVPATRREDILDSLNYEVMNDHYLSIEPAYASTCQWLFKKIEYTEWLNEARPSEHRGFLWIKGNPGTGKTILMKSASQHAQRSPGNGTVISFFFNGNPETPLATSTEGMYRSLVFQLMEKISRLQPILDKHRRMDHWPVKILSNLFREAVLALRKDRLTCYIDALDQCAELEIRTMLEVFEDLAKSAREDHIDFHVCFSSRHHPNFCTNHSRALVLEDQVGHKNGISTYIQHKLQASVRRKPEIVNEIKRKSSGVFLWVDLVIGILNKDSDDGTVHTIETRLQVIPNKLDDLFQTIVKQGIQEDALFVPTLQCIMFARRPLRCEELYHAVNYAYIVDFKNPGPDVAKKFLLNKSKGLARTTKGKQATVQFIHESVREYLLTTGLSVLTQEPNHRFESSSHEYLRLSCLHFVSEKVSQRILLPGTLPPEKKSEQAELREKASRLFPFLQYAVENVVFHTERACRSFVSVEDVTKSFPVSTWKSLNNMFEKYQLRRYERDETRAYIFADRGAPHLLEAELQLGADHFPMKCRHLSLLFAAVFEENLEVVKTILKHDGMASLTAEEQRRCLTQALKKQSPVIADLLLQKGLKIDIVVKHKGYNKFLQVAYDRGHEFILEKLLVAGETQNKDDNSALQAACVDGHEQVAQLLLDRGAEVNARSGHYGNALQAACANGHQKLAQTLLGQGAEVYAPGGYHASALRAAEVNGHQKVVQLLRNHLNPGIQVTPDEPPPYLKVRELMTCRDQFCNLGKYCWCDARTNKHYHLLGPELKRLMQHIMSGNKLESHDDIPDELRQELYAKDSSVHCGTENDTTRVR